jgi:hypothetical protein
MMFTICFASFRQNFSICILFNLPLQCLAQGDPVILFVEGLPAEPPALLLAIDSPTGAGLRSLLMPIPWPAQTAADAYAGLQ